MLDKVKFLPIVPVIDYKIYGDDAKVIEKVVNDNGNGVKNIGIIAPYGAGKSSALETYKDLNSKHENKRILNISLASFNESEFNENKKKEKSSGLEDIDENSIEKSILQQMLYSQKASNLPESRISRIRPLPRIIVFSSMLLFAGLISCFLSYGLSFVPALQINIASSITCLVLGVIFAFGLITLTVKYYQLKNIKFKDIEIAFDPNQKGQSILNKFLDEVIYFFEKTKYNIVIFEDLDRFENLNIFVKLRELNIILNNNATLAKRGKVVFIYAIKDTMFKTNAEKTKFFDFIVPILPILSPKNAREKLREGLIKSGLGSEEKDWLPNDFIVEVSYFINDMRVLNNIINDCVLMLNKVKYEDIKEIDELTFNRNLFSLMAYKNINPQEFVKIQNEDGELGKVLNKAKQEIKTFLENKESEIKAEEEKLKAEPFSSSWDNLKKMVKGYLVSTDAYSTSSGTDIDKLTTFQGVNSITCKAEYSYYYFNLSISELNELIKGDTIQERERKIKEVDKVRREVINKINDLKIRASTYTKISPFEYIKNNSKLTKEINTKFLQFLLNRGYFPERYQDYLSYSGGEKFVSKNDQVLIQSIFLSNFADPNKQNNFDYKIDDPYTLINDLPEHYFTTDKLLNVTIVKEFFKSKDLNSNKRLRLKENLLTNTEIVNDFIAHYFENETLEENATQKIIDFLLKERRDFFIVLLTHNINYELINKYICYALKTLTAEEFCQLENFQELISLIGNSKTIYQYCSDNYSGSIKEVLLKGNVLFSEILLSSELTQFDKFIIESSLYAINIQNLNAISAAFGSPDPSRQFSFIMNNEKMLPVRDYTLSNLNKYVESVLLCNDSLNLELKDITILLNNEAVSLLQKKEICNKVHTIPFHEEYKKEVAEILFEYPYKVDITYKLLIELDKRYNFDMAILCKFILDKLEYFRQVTIDNTRIIYGLANSELLVAGQTIFQELYDAFNKPTFSIYKIANEHNIYTIIEKNAIEVDVPSDLEHLLKNHYDKALKLYIEKFSKDIVSEECVNQVLDSFIKYSSTPIEEYIDELIPNNVKTLSKEAIKILVDGAINDSVIFSEDVYKIIEDMTDRQADLFVHQFNNNDDSKENFVLHLQKLQEPFYANSLAVDGKVTIEQDKVGSFEVIELLLKNNYIEKKKVKGGKVHIKLKEDQD